MDLVDAAARAAIHDEDLERDDDDLEEPLGL